MKMLLVLFYCLSAIATDFPEGELAKILKIDSDSGIRGPAYAKIVEELKLLQDSYPEYASLVNYGTTIGGKPLSLI